MQIIYIGLEYLKLYNYALIVCIILLYLKSYNQIGGVLVY